jgi:hypothetical protein
MEFPGAVQQALAGKPQPVAPPGIQFGSILWEALEGASELVVLLGPFQEWEAAGPRRKPQCRWADRAC